MYQNTEDLRHNYTAVFFVSYDNLRRIFDTSTNVQQFHQIYRNYY
jgi:hypothetical protein